MAVASCGHNTTRAQPRPDPEPTPDSSEIAGHWQWTHISERDQVRRVEQEHWHLTRSGDTISGRYDREVNFLSLTDQPFRCSQTITYRMRTRFRVAGQITQGTLSLRETGYETEPSPCDRGLRTLGRYRGERTGIRLTLRWKDGEQILTRGTRTRSAQAPFLPPLRVAGRWQWRNTNPATPHGMVRVEAEDWQLRELGGGTLGGQYRRSVTVINTHGKPFPCSGSARYHYTDEYEVKGLRRGNKLHLTEIAATPQKHPCLDYTQRHLDAATGQITPQFLVLDWRGRTQVMHRPITAPAAE